MGAKSEVCFEKWPFAGKIQEFKSPHENPPFCSTGCIKKTEQIWNRSQCREAAQSMKFFIINIDCLGTYDVE